jgi:hypothetical protein
MEAGHAHKTVTQYVAKREIEEKYHLKGREEGMERVQPGFGNQVCDLTGFPSY